MCLMSWSRRGQRNAREGDGLSRSCRSDIRRRRSGKTWEDRPPDTVLGDIAGMKGLKARIRTVLRGGWRGGWGREPKVVEDRREGDP